MMKRSLNTTAMELIAERHQPGVRPKLTYQFEGDRSQDLHEPLANLAKLWTKVKLSFRRRRRGVSGPRGAFSFFSGQLVDPLEQMSTMIHANQTDVQLEPISQEQARQSGVPVSGRYSPAESGVPVWDSRSSTRPK
jgi:hypothetical protein